jgi:hypothetical protein
MTIFNHNFMTNSRNNLTMMTTISLHAPKIANPQIDLIKAISQNLEVIISTFLGP